MEVGSGWGSMAMLDAEEYGAEVVNYGLVPEQNRVMQARLEQRGLSGRVRIVERDHRDLIRDRHMTGICQSVSTNMLVLLNSHVGSRVSRPR